MPKNSRPPKKEYLFSPLQNCGICCHVKSASFLKLTLLNVILSSIFLAMHIPEFYSIFPFNYVIYILFYMVYCNLLFFLNFNIIIKLN